MAISDQRLTYACVPHDEEESYKEPNSEFLTRQGSDEKYRCQAGVVSKRRHYIITTTLTTVSVVLFFILLLLLSSRRETKSGQPLSADFIPRGSCNLLLSEPISR